MCRIGAKKQTSSWKSTQNKPRKRRTTNNLQWRSKSSSKITIWRIVSTTRKRSEYCEQTFGANSRITGSSEFIIRRQRISQSLHSEQFRGITRSYPTRGYSESRRNAWPRFCIAGYQMEYHGWLGEVWIKSVNKNILLSFEARSTLALTSKLSEERKFVIYSGASMHMLSTKDLSSEELETLRRSRPLTWW